MSDYMNLHAVEREMILICKPEQSGKTFVMIRQIIDEFQKFDNEYLTSIPINIIMCDNNLLLTRQTEQRISCDVSDHKCIEFSSKSERYKTPDNIIAAILTGDDDGNEIRNIICCANTVRFKDLKTIIDRINKNPKNEYHFNIWLDEADKFVKQIDTILSELVSSNDNVQLKLLTATPEPLFKKYKKMNVYPIENTFDKDKYHGWEDNIITPFDMNRIGCVSFIEHVFDFVKKGDNIIKPGTKWFIPGISQIDSHNKVKDICLENNMAVLCVNSKGIVLTLPDTKECIVIEKGDDMMCSNIIKIYDDYGLCRFPFAITGNICIGRGVTLMSEDFIFDYGILSQCAKKNEASQIAGRFKGNIKHYHNYKVPRIFTTVKFNEIATEWEQRSRELARIAFKKNIEAPSVVTKREFEEKCVSETDSECGSETDSVLSENEKGIRKEANAVLRSNAHINEVKEFKVWEEAFTYLSGFVGHSIHAKSKPNRDENRDDKYPEFFKTSTTKTAKVFQTDELRQEIGNMGFSNYQPKKGCLKYGRLYVGYDDLTNPDDYTIFVRSAELEDNAEVHNALNALSKKSSEKKEDKRMEKERKMAEKAAEKAAEKERKMAEKESKKLANKKI